MFKKTISLLLLLSLATSMSAQNLDRDKVEDKYKWNLAEIYPTVDAWKAAKDALEERIADIAKYQGKLGEKADNLLYTLDTQADIYKELYRLYGYASQKSDENLNITENAALDQQMQSLATKASEVSSYMQPEILKIDAATIEKFYAEKPELKLYKKVIDNVQRNKAHTLTEEQEKIMASFGLVTGTMANVYGIFNNAEIPAAKVTLADGKDVDITNPMYVRLRSTENREDRAKIFDAFFNNYGKFKNTIAANLSGKVKADYVYAKNRNFKTALEASLNGPNIPVSVYKNLISNIHKSLPTLHRFLDLKKKMMGLDEIHYYDLYAPIVEAVDMNFTIEQGQDVILKAIAPMGKDYVATVQRAFDERWIDYMPTVGKRGGAYSSGASYDVHPYILMNWTDSYNSVSTLAHELGHTMHSYLSNTNQPFVYSDYATYVAEIASTCNESLLNNYMVKNVKSDKEKIYLLGSYLELLRNTIFRQTMFAEFELKIHEYVEAGKPLNGDVMSEIYYDLVKTYYGHDKGHCVVDPYIAYEWAYIPHFINYAYYVYQYSTSLIYATAFAEKIQTEGQPAVDKYYNILKGGSSEYPIELIRKAGLDPLSSEPFELTMQKMNKVMDQIEELMKK